MLAIFRSEFLIALGAGGIGFCLLPSANYMLRGRGICKGRGSSLTPRPSITCPRQCPKGAKSFGQAFSKACRVQRQGLWSLPAGSEIPQGDYHNGRACAEKHRPCRSILGRQAAVLNSGFWVRLGPMAVFRPTGQEAQTAAGVRSSRYLPKTARCAPQAL